MNPLLIAQLAFGGLQFLHGASQESDAQKLAAENPRPVANTAGLYDDLVNRFSAESQYGIDRNARSFANQANNNNFTAGLSAMLQAGGNANSVSSLYGASTDATEKLAVSDSDRRWQKVNAMATVVDKQNDAKVQDWLYNYDAPYKDKARLSAQKEMMGYNQEMTGLDYSLGALTNSVKHFQDAKTTAATATTAGLATSGAPASTDMFQGPSPAEFLGTLPNEPFTWQSQPAPIVPKPTGGVSSLSSMFSVPGKAAGRTATSILTDIFSGKVKGYDANGNPIY